MNNINDDPILAELMQKFIQELKEYTIDFNKFIDEAKKDGTLDEYFIDDSAESVREKLKNIDEIIKGITE